MATRTVEDLKPNPKNPRKITDAKLQQLEKALKEFGDLGGFVFNRRTQNLVSGHQRAKLLDIKQSIKIETSYSRPTRTGTVAEGYVVLHGERFRYREVDWDEQREKAATIAANKSAGEWDNALLGEWLTDLDDFGFDLDTTMFDASEREKLAKKNKKTKVSEHEREIGGSKEITEDDIGEFEHVCPRCAFEFNDKAKK